MGVLFFLWGGGKGEGEGGRERLFPALPFQRRGWGGDRCGGERREKRSPQGGAPGGSPGEEIAVGRDRERRR